MLNVERRVGYSYTHLLACLLRGTLQRYGLPRLDVLTLTLTLTLTKALLNAMNYLDLLTLKPSGGIDAEERI